MDDQNPGPRERLQSQAEETVGKIAQDLLSNPLVAGAIGRAFEAREKAVQAQEVAFNALNIPSAADIERLTRRVRSVSQRLEGIEDGVDRLDERLAGLTGAARLEERLEGIEQALAALVQEINVLREALPDPEPGVSRSQERLKVGDD
jgi:chromosome segregation ATPase